MFIARSLVFYPGFFEDNCKELSDEIILPAYYLNKMMERFDDNERLYVNIINVETNQSMLVTIGTCHSYDKNTIFAPQWILDLIGCSGNCDSVIRIEKADVSEVPVATKIIIKPLDPIAFELDTLKCFETAFMNLHSIKEGITIQIPVPELGKDYTMFAHIEGVEPAPVSRIIEGEVNVEFINEFNDPTVRPVMEPTNLNTIVTPILEPTPASISPIPTVPIPTESLEDKEERRRRVRDAWVKRYQNPPG
jgi:hypothetical protein